MPEAAYQFLTLNKEQDEPEVGELREGEVVINLVDGRLWVGDEFAVPIELGKNARTGIVSNNPLASNYTEVTMVDSGDFPINLPNPNEVLPGTYQELTFLMSYANEYVYAEPPSGFANQTIKWDKIDQPLITDPTPLEYYSSATPPTEFIFKLYAFGPREHWFGKVIWADR